MCPLSWAAALCESGHNNRSYWQHREQIAVCLSDESCTIILEVVSVEPRDIVLVSIDASRAFPTRGPIIAQCCVIWALKDADR